MSLEDVKAGQRQLSARTLNDAGRDLAEAHPTFSEGDGAPASQSVHRLGSAPFSNDRGKLFYVRITKLGDTHGAKRGYEFEEVGTDYQEFYAGGGTARTAETVAVPAGKVARDPENPAFAVSDTEFQVGDYAIARRSLVSPYAWELLPVGGAGGDSSFLAVLVEKEGNSANLITYSWAGVTPAAPNGYELTGEFGCPDHDPAFHERNFDLPVVGAVHAGSGEGSGSGASGGACPHPAFIHPLSVVRLRRVGGGGSGSGAGSGSGSGGFCLFSGHPWEDLFKRSGVVGSEGEAVNHRYYSQPGGGWADGISCVMIEAE